MQATDEDLFSATSRICGRGVAETLREQFRGSCLYIPKRISRTHKIARCIGLNNAEKLSAALGGGHFSVALNASRAPKRHQTIKLLSLAGLYVCDIARIIDLSDRHVSRIRAELRAVGQLPSKIAKDNAKNAYKR